MAKRKSTVDPKAANLILWVLGLATAVLSLVGLVSNFITWEGQESVWGTTSKGRWNLGEWFDNINDMNNFDKIGNWLFARVMLIITVVLLLAMVGLLVANFFKKLPALKWTTVGVGLAVAVGAVIFMITTIAGCSALSVKIGVTSFTYLPSFGVFVFGLGALVSAVLTEVVVFRK